MTEDRARCGTRPRHLLWLMLALLGAFTLSAVVSVAANAVDAKKVRNYEVPVSSPEGVFYDKETKAFYGGSAMDGEIYKAKLDGAKLKRTKTFMEPNQDGEGNTDTRNTAHGINVDEERRMYIAGVVSGQLHVYKLPKGNKIATVQTPGTGGYINDVDFAPNGDVYFTDSNRPIMWRVSEAQIEAGGTITNPQAIQLDDPTDPNDVDYTKDPRSTNGLEVNGIRFTPNGEFVIFNSLNNGELYRLTPIENDPAANPVVLSADSEIVTLTGATPAELGDQDGLEFLNGNTLYAADNSATDDPTAPGGPSPERILKLRLSNNYTEVEVLSETTSDSFRTPATISLAPKERLLVSNLELFDPEPGTPFFVSSIKRP